jgi:hypothetical protein
MPMLEDEEPILDEITIAGDEEPDGDESAVDDSEGGIPESDDPQAADPTVTPDDEPQTDDTGDDGAADAVDGAAPTTDPEPSAPPPSPDGCPPRKVLANYFAWYDEGTWSSCAISDGDRPIEPYNSDNEGAIWRQVRQALDVGIDGFTLQWFAPGERTDQNLRKLLAQSQGTGFQSTVIFLRHIWHGSPEPSQDNVAEAIRYLIDEYGGHPNFLAVDGQPVLIFADVYRVPRTEGQTPQQAWEAIRARVDPEHRTIWIGEGLDPSYLAVFDGLYVYKITHADYPNDYVKASRRADGVRRWERETGRQKIWMGTISPGWDDLRSGCQPDVRVPSKPHKRDRADGSFYRATYDAAVASQADWLWINSFNEWVEGTYIEPGERYGDRYLHLTRELISAWK